MSFAFLPRKVVKSNTQPQQITSTSKFSTTSATTAKPALDASSHHHNHGSSQRRKAPSETPAEELSRLAELALSDYAISQNQEISMKLQDGEDGYIPLSWLLHKSQVFKHLGAPPSVSATAKVIREHASDIMELRMALTEPSQAAWRNQRASVIDEGGGYEVRRKQRSTMYLNTIKWEDRTIYVERVPHAHWSLGALALFIDALVGPTNEKSVQHVELPAHQFDKPGAVPRCKGFALVVLSSVEDAEHLAQSWPWEITEPSRSASEAEEAGTFKAAQSSGFRVLCKAEWERLKTEYLGYRQFLLSQLAEDPFLRDEPEESHDDGGDVVADYWDAEEAVPSTGLEEADGLLPADAPFPPGCLLFLRGVHSRTNRTVLRTLLGKALVRCDNPSEGVDYVDYTKGMDTCYARVTASSHALSLVKYFTTNPLVQHDAADSIGVQPPSADTAPIVVEQVLGRPEELYWERVPEKVRQAAVQKARQAAGFEAEAMQLDHGNENEDGDFGIRKRKRKRRA